MSEEIKKPRKPRVRKINTDIPLGEENGLSKIEKIGMIKAMPVVPVRDVVMFPGLIISLFIGRKRSINAVNLALAESRNIILVTQKDSNKDDVNIEDIPDIATLGVILQCIVLPDETVKVLVDCTHRVLVSGYYFSDPITCDGEMVKNIVLDQSRGEVYSRSLVENYEIYASLNKKIPVDSIKNVNAAPDLSATCDIIASYLTIKDDKKLDIAITVDLEERVKKILHTLNFEINILKAEKELHDMVRSHMDKNQKEYYLNEQMKVIKKELGEHDDVEVLIDKYRAIMAKKPGLTQEAITKIEDEFKKLRHTPTMSSEAGILKSYLDWILNLPWKEFGKKDVSVHSAREILSGTHYGMEKIKERVLEYIAVQKSSNKSGGTVLCLYGPPGVGKTTLVRTIASAMGREYVKISLGGLHDSSELFGHIRTYIGALPGRIIKGMKKAKVSDPVILLDEIDKMSSDYRGDPAAAMLEILDPEQNSAFFDHYMEIGYDLSNVVFIATANSLNFSPPLRDRMELMHVPSYLEQEKLEIAKKYILPRQMDLCNLSQDNIQITDEAISYTIQKYTREAGVRELERCIAKITRKVVVKKMESIEKTAQNLSENLILTPDEGAKKSKKKQDDFAIKINKDEIHNYLGVEKFSHSEIESENLIGVVNGLAYTESGGDVLLIEGVKIPGKGALKFTGRLGDVMKESMQAAYSYIQANAEKFGIDHKDCKKLDIHIHAPEGATPKDGPSAGVTISTAIVSLLTGTKVKKDVAMTGEITLRGRVLAIGGLREKLVSAVRSGIKDVIIPAQNVKDLEDIPEDVKSKLNIHPCENLFEVLKIALDEKDGGSNKKSKLSEKPKRSDDHNKADIAKSTEKSPKKNKVKINDEVPLF